jgi:prepilin-type processing-associated H-X9-DG protein
VSPVGRTAYLPPVLSHADCCRGDDLRHEAISEAPVLFADGHACVDCCPCPDCGAYRASLWEQDPSAWHAADYEGKRAARTSRDARGAGAAAAGPVTPGRASRVPRIRPAGSAAGARHRTPCGRFPPVTPRRAKR